MKLYYVCSNIARQLKEKIIIIHKQTLSLCIIHRRRKACLTIMYRTHGCTSQMYWMKLNTLCMSERFHYSHIISFPHSEPATIITCTHDLIHTHRHTHIYTKKIENNKFQTSSPVTMGTQKTSHICNIRNIWWYQMNSCFLKCDYWWMCFQVNVFTTLCI